MVECLGSLLQAYVPVDSLSRAPAVPRPVVEVPEAGLRWGKPASFEYSAATRPTRDGGGFDAKFPPDPTVYMRILEADAEVEFGFANKLEPPNFIEMKRIIYIGFSYTEPLPKRTISQFMAYRYTTVKLRLSLHPEDEDEGEAP